LAKTKSLILGSWFKAASTTEFKDTVRLVPFFV
jgi:hypothetical protein